MVWTFSPPGVSSAVAKSRRARARCGASGSLAGRKFDPRVERGVVERGPFRQRIEHAGRHVGGGGLCEGDAKDFLGLDAAQQQVDHPLHQHVRLAGAGVGGHEH